MQCLGHRQVQLVTERSLGNGNLGALGQHAVAAPPAHWADGWRSSVGPIPAHVCLSSPTFYSEGVEGSQIPKGGRWPLRSARQAQEWRQFRPRQPSSYLSAPGGWPRVHVSSSAGFDWFPAGEFSAGAAKAVCGTCCVKATCLSNALAHHEHGSWRAPPNGTAGPCIARPLSSTEGSVGGSGNALGAPGASAAAPPP